MKMLADLDNETNVETPILNKIKHQGTTRTSSQIIGQGLSGSYALLIVHSVILLDAYHTAILCKNSVDLDTSVNVATTAILMLGWFEWGNGVWGTL